MTKKRWMIGSVVVASFAAFAVACTIQQEQPESPQFGTDPDPPSKTPQNEVVDAGTSSSSSSSSGGSSSGSTAKSDGGDAAAACLGDQGAAPKCEPGACNYHCTNYSEDYKKAIAVEIMKCHTKTQCNGDPNKCGETVLKNACPDPTAATYCAPIVAACAGAGGDTLTKTQCETLAKGFNAKGRENFKYCVEQDVGQGNCKYDSAQCYYLFQ